jgi:hypothetical protein
MPDRTVHAITADGHRIVRYDRAGKWYVEEEFGARRISLAEAVDMAARRGSAVFLGKPGGSAFDHEVTKAILGKAAQR